MLKKVFFAFAILALLLSSTTTVFADKPTGFDNQGNVISSTGDNGFDEWGYNRTARIFSGTGMSWCMQKGGSELECTASLGAYVNDKLVMKWNAEWDRGKAEGWNNPPYNAQLNNVWNGHVEGGSGETWLYKYVWIGSCGVDYTPLENGGYCIWGQFAVIVSHGIADGEHVWDTRADPAGYGAYYNKP